jgi:ubiquitin C-terminal hydrolase
MVLLGDISQVEACFVPFVSTEDRCTVCVECTTGMEIFSAHLMVLLGDVDRVNACFGPFGDNINLEAR